MRLARSSYSREQKLEVSRVPNLCKDGTTEAVKVSYSSDKVNV